MTNDSSLATETTGLPDTIWYSRCPVPTAAGIAIQNGLLDDAFAPDGVLIRSMRHSKDPKIRESHYTHTLENSFRQGGNGPALFARSEGKDTVLLGVHWIPQYQAILALPGSGLTNVEDLKGKRLALPRRVNDPIDYWCATAMQGYENALRLAGLTLSDVELIDLPIEKKFVDSDVEITDTLPPAFRTVKLQTREMAALIRGEVDAIFGYSVWGAELRSQIDAVEVVTLSGLPMEQQVNNGAPETLTVSGGLLREHPELVERYLVELFRAADWAKNNQDLARRAMAIETGTAEYWLDKGIGADFVDRLHFSMDEPLLQALEDRKQFLLKHGFLHKDFDMRSWADPRPVQRALERLRSE